MVVGTETFRATREITDPPAIPFLHAPGITASGLADYQALQSGI
jgi:hypothetical protein